MMAYFHYKVKVKGHDLAHYPVKLLKRLKGFRFSQNVFTFFIPVCSRTDYRLDYMM